MITHDLAHHYIVTLVGRRTTGSLLCHGFARINTDQPNYSKCLIREYHLLIRVRFPYLPVFPQPNPQAGRGFAASSPTPSPAL
jgi:hypothetical protein